MSKFPRVTDIRTEHQETDGRDDLAYVRGTYTMKFQPEGSPTPMEDTGKWLVICKKQNDGSWLWAGDTYTSDKPIK
jgi:ketosteroid isomerase-like protein